MVVDLLLRRLQRLFPDALFRAFADDIGAVFRDLPKDAARIIAIGKISGLELNMPKTIAIPLWDQDVGEAKSRVTQSSQDWEKIQFAGFSIYLGFATGPEKGDASWSKATDKFLKRATLWGLQGTGLHVGTAAYNTFAVSVLSFIAQLEDPTDEVRQAESKAIRKIASGPFNWISLDDAWFLKEGYGQTESFVSIDTLAKASQLRVAHGEDWLDAGTPLGIRSGLLKSSIKNTDLVVRRHRWRDWYSRSCIIKLQDNLDDLKSKGITIKKIKLHILGDKPESSVEDRAKNRRDPIKLKFQ